MQPKQKYSVDARIRIHHFRLSFGGPGRDENDEVYFIAMGEPVFGFLKVEYVSYHHRGFTAISFLSITLPPALPAAILNTFSPKESYLRSVSISHLKYLICTHSPGKGCAKVSVKNRWKRCGCLKILATGIFIFLFSVYSTRQLREINFKLQKNCTSNINKKLFKVSTLS